MGPNFRLIEVANKFVGITEYNPFFTLDSKTLSEFNSIPKVIGQPWNLTFLKYCVNKVSLGMDIKTILHDAGSVMALWNKTNEYYRLDTPVIGSIVVWHYYKYGMGTGKGHCAIVSGLPDDQSIETIEGGEPNGIGLVSKTNRVFKMHRSARGSDSFRLLGYLNAWNLEELELQLQTKRRHK